MQLRNGRCGKIEGAVELLQQQARDGDALVRHEAVVAAAAFEGLGAAEVVFLAQSRPLDDQLKYAISQTRLRVDRYWQQAIKDGRPLSPAGQAFVLSSAQNADLLRMPRSEAVCLAILGRGAIAPKDQTDALTRLAKFTGQGRGQLLIEQIRQHAEAKSAAYPELVALLHKLPAAELATIKPHLAKIVRTAGNSRLRSAAIAALINAGEVADTVFQMAGTSYEQTIAYLDSARLVQDASRRGAMYGSIRSLIFDTPAHLKPKGAGVTVGGEGKEFGPDLTKLDSKKFTPEMILRSMLEPSSQINEKFQTTRFLLDSGEIVTGMVIAETPAIVTVVVDPLAKVAPLVIKQDEIDQRIKSPISLMPKGLLSKLTREEILDLLAYVYARGDKKHTLFHAGHEPGKKH